MATILFQAAGAALGSVFGPFGAIIGRAAGALAGSVVDRSIINGMTTITGARLSDARIPGAEEGTVINRVYGTVRIGGTLIWATRFEEEVTSERSGGKATGPRVETYSYFGNFAVGICEGPIAGVRRIWADGRELDLTTIEMRLHKGREGQAPDPLIEAKQGEGKAPAYRGLAYAVFEHLPLDGFGNRIPVLQFEVIRPVGKLEKRIRAVTIIPGSSEHGYDPRLVTERTGSGAGRNINRNTMIAETDWTVSIDELQSLCPNLERVALVTAWFGTDLRARRCRIVPGVEVASRNDESRPWSVSGILRADAHLVSRSGGGPAYGGTPSDASVVAAISDLKARGLKVYLYPFVLMDIPEDNGLADPYGGGEQAAYPWRGRITCHPAIGESGSADRSAEAREQVEEFCGAAREADFEVSGETVTGPVTDEGFRRMVLHYALLAKAAGGVDGFIVGSEMRGLTRVRDGDGKFPFVDALRDLASDVRDIVGAGTRLTYGADWSEYFGYQPADGSGEVHYNLDPLWASPAIDAVGIDNYMPLSDWRDGDTLSGNPDGFSLSEDAGAMRAMIARGEGFDWYYQSAADRRARERAPITDGLFGEPWIYRYKDIESWWSNHHHGRSDGTRATSPSDWVPRSKPIWFTELGCPAVDKGANQPNVFTDPKSSEDALPYFSTGLRADALQRRFLDAHLGWWTRGEADPEMVDADHIFLWTWDARPYPAFPENTDLWSDGGNWQRGHWLNGRLGAGTVADVIAAILEDHGFDDYDVSGVGGDLSGFVQAEQTSARSLLESLMAAFQIDAIEEGGTLRFRSRLRAAAPGTEIAVLAERPDETSFEETRAHASELAGEVILDHFADQGSYSRVVARSRRMVVDNDRVMRLSLPGVLHEGAAAQAVEAALRDHRMAQRQISFRLPPNMLAPVPGDVVTLVDGPSGSFLVTRTTDAEVREVEARAFAGAEGAGGEPDDDEAPRSTGAVLSASQAFMPDLHFLDLPGYEAGQPEDFARVSAQTRPWKPILVSSSPVFEGYRSRVRVDRPARSGRLVASLGPGVVGRFDHANVLVTDIDYGGLCSADRLSVLDGANRIAVASTDGRWEIIGFLDAEEISGGRWRLSGLLRGLAGSEDAMAAGHTAQSAVVVLDEAVRPLGIAADEAGRSLNWIAERIGGGGGMAGPIAFAGGVRALTPLAPVHLRARRDVSGQIRFSWTRRGRVNADSWLSTDIPLDEPQEAYRLDILAGNDPVRTVDLLDASYVYPVDTEIADFGTVRTEISFRVRQKGQSVPLGIPAEQTITL
ncbi:glycoside hydrolase TIM-barrel-like domain-containing protein [Sinorhizobium sp. BG8]|uniref:baseplate multidomain protein megatron n=1 Tax=Sinorhizobium sp. BG8 TaxID=2613773 RepID=UPI00193E9544|nr:glycoside hydrolase TIM-barrel-like domain-containing protein [Sinorhizobium sp. BG8]QRM54762.1 hypothetical protein F3Y30_09560 [Sinorhizobium sp. BG8]